jgi:glycosyltransferase involved in cell wall biosynthesis
MMGSALRQTENPGKPAVTFLVLAFNQARFIREAIQGALAQTYSPLQIIISDDSSQDQTFSIIQSEVSSYSGPHEVCARQTSANLGLIAHLNQVMEVVTGDLVVIAGGDDISFPHRVRSIVEIWAQGDVMVVCSNAILIDDRGLSQGLFWKSSSCWLSPTDMIKTGRTGVFGAGLAWDRRVFEAFGPLSKSTRNEDGIISFRGALLGRVRYTGEPLLYYRQHEKNLSFGAQMSFATTSRWIALQQAKLQNRVRLYEEWMRLLEDRQEKGIPGIDYPNARSTLAARVAVFSLENRLLTESPTMRLRTFQESMPLITGFRDWVRFVLLTISPTAYAVVLRQGRRVARHVWGMASSLWGYRRKY